MNETLNQKLLTRTKSAVVFGIIVIGLLSYNYWTNILFLALVGIFSTREFYLLDKNKLDQLQFNELMALLISSVFIMFPLYGIMQDEYWFYYSYLGIAVIYSILAIVNLYTPFGWYNYVKFNRHHLEIYTIYPLVLASILITEMETFSYFLLKVIVLIWVCDSGAYLVGSRIGKNKLFPSVSPNKTIEGSIGAGVLTLLGGLAIGQYFDASGLFYWVGLAAIVWISGTYGDLVQSKIKRQYKIKDSGNIMPGHGGFLDRFDSFIFVWPFIAVWHLFIYS
jgi:phosphatidate cytidylyltransferase